MTRKFGAELSASQHRLARRFEEAGLATLSQAVKAFERHNDAQIEAWVEQLRQLDAAAGRPWNR